MEGGFHKDASLQRSPRTGKKAEAPEKILFSENLLLTSLVTPTPRAAGGVKIWIDNQDSPQMTGLWD